MAEFLERGEYSRSHKRLVWMVIVQFVLIIAFTGLFYTISQANQQERCLDNQQRAKAAATLLPRIVSAAEADGDTKMAAFWKDYLVTLQRVPPVQC